MWVVYRKKVIGPIVVISSLEKFFCLVPFSRGENKGWLRIMSLVRARVFFFFFFSPERGIQSPTGRCGGVELSWWQNNAFAEESGHTYNSVDLSFHHVQKILLRLVWAIIGCIHAHYCLRLKRCQSGSRSPLAESDKKDYG